MEAIGTADQIRYRIGFNKEGFFIGQHDLIDSAIESWYCSKIGHGSIDLQNTGNITLSQATQRYVALYRRPTHNSEDFGWEEKAKLSLQVLFKCNNHTITKQFMGPSQSPGTGQPWRRWWWFSEWWGRTCWPGYGIVFWRNKFKLFQRSGLADMLTEEMAIMVINAS